jgi:hypothetical protein
MVIVTLYEDRNGDLYLHLRGDVTLWRISERTASTFLTDAMVVANEDTASHPAIFFSRVPWEPSLLDNPEKTRVGKGTLHAIAAVRLDPSMGIRAAAYTLFRRE